MPIMRRTHTAADLDGHTPDEWNALIANVQRSISHGRCRTAQDPTAAIYAAATGDRPARPRHASDDNPDWVFVHAAEHNPEGAAEKRAPTTPKERKPEATSTKVEAEADSDWLMVTGSGGE